jgi:ABC-type branched-subunit amino acid transport system substrate-binding protein
VQRLRWLAIFFTIALVVAACGRDDESSDAGDANQTTNPSGATGETGGDGDAEQAGLDEGGFGDLGVLCQEAPEGQTNTAGTDPGVTADSIQINTFSDPGYSGRQGLNQEMFDTAEAFTKWCNEHGGINGRQIELKLRDAKLFEFQQRVIEACDEGDFFSVGGGAVFDDTGQTERLGCGLPIIPGYVVTVAASDADLTIQPVPNKGTEQPIGHFQWLQKTFPESVEHVGIFTGQIETTIVVADRNKEAVQDLGFNIVYEGTYSPLGETTWRPFLEAMRSNGVRGLIYVGEPGNLAKLLTEAQSLDVTFDWVSSDANQYDAQLTDNAGPAADGLYVRSAFHPFLDPDEAKENPATQQYLDLIEQYDPGGKIAGLGIQGLSSWLLFAKAAGECGAELTRDCVYEKASAVQEWTGGGLHSVQDLSTGGHASKCFVLMTVKDGAFERAEIDPNEGVFRCDEGGVYALKGDYGTGAKCPNPAYATDPKPSNCA